MKLPLSPTTLSTIEGVADYLRTLATSIQAGWNKQHTADGGHNFPKGKWTPMDLSGAGLVFTLAEGTYQRTDQLIYAWFKVEFPTTVDATAVAIGGLPFPVAISSRGQSTGSAAISYTTYGTPITGYPNDRAVLFYTFGGTPVTNANLSTRQVFGTAIYLTE